jgi:integrase
MTSRRRHFGTVRKLPSGRWQARYYDLAGNRHTAPRTFATKTDALQHLALVEADMHRGTWTDPALARTLFSTWVQRWQSVNIPALRPSTQDLYRYLLRRLLLPTFGPLALASIDSMEVRGWLARLKAEGTVSAGTRAKAYRLLRRILADAVEAGYLSRNPCTIKGAGRERTPEMRHVNADQLAALADAIAPRYRALVLLAGYGGLRWGELAGLRRHRVDLAHATVTMVEQVSEVAGTFHIGAPKTETSIRTVTLPKVVTAALADHLDRWAEPSPTGLVFPAPRGGYLRHSNFRRRYWLKAVHAAELDGLRFHDLRHTAATLARAAGATTRELMARMGQSTAEIALRYEHVMTGRDAAIADALDQLASGCGWGDG